MVARYKSSLVPRRFFLQFSLSYFPLFLYAVPLALTSSTYPYPTDWYDTRPSKENASFELSTPIRSTPSAALLIERLILAPTEAMTLTEMPGTLGRPEPARGIILDPAPLLAPRSS